MRKHVKVIEGLGKGHTGVIIQESNDKNYYNTVRLDTPLKLNGYEAKTIFKKTENLEVISYSETKTYRPFEEYVNEFKSNNPDSNLISTELIDRYSKDVLLDQPEKLEVTGWSDGVTLHQHVDTCGLEFNPELDYIELERAEVQQLTRFLLAWLMQTEE